MENAYINSMKNIIISVIIIAIDITALIVSIINLVGFVVIIALAIGFICFNILKIRHLNGKEDTFQIPILVKSCKERTYSKSLIKKNSKKTKTFLVKGLDINNREISFFSEKEIETGKEIVLTLTKKQFEEYKSKNNSFISYIFIS